MATKPKRTNRPFGRSLSDFPNLSPVEKELIEFCRIGEPLILGNGNRPEKPTKENTISPGLIRFLALGGDDNNKVHEMGVRLKGAWLDDDLDLSQCICPSNIGLINCVVKGSIGLQDSQLKTFALNGCHIEKLNAERAQIAGSIFLKNQFKATGEVRLLGAQIRGNFECSNGQFEPKQGNALSADRAVIKGSVLLDEGFNAAGEVRFLGAQIGGNFECSKGQFEPKQGNALSADSAVIKGGVFLDEGFKATGEVRLLGAQIGGNLACRNGQFEPKQGYALSADNAVIKGNVFLDEGFKATGPVRFSGAQIGSLIDDTNLIARGIILDGLEYGNISGSAATDSSTRIAWLNKQPHDHLYENFKPQPWEQLIKVLRTMGHTADADAVAIAKQDQLYRAGKITGINKVWHKLYCWFAGYGYKPIRTIGAMLLVWIFWAGLFGYAKQSGWMAPSSPIIHTSELIRKNCELDAVERQKAKANITTYDDAKISVLSNCSVLPNEYTTFNAFVYSLDLILPLVDLQQDKDWSPMVLSTDPWISPRPLIRFAMWFEILFGWMASLLLAAVLGNLVKKD